jgi:hypothetical protein
MNLQEEVGPYTFQKVRLKRGVEWVRGGASVRWREYRYHLPVPELSNGSLDDPITTLNVPLLGERFWSGISWAAGALSGCSGQCCSQQMLQLKIVAALFIPPQAPSSTLNLWAPGRLALSWSCWQGWWRVGGTGA